MSQPYDECVASGAGHNYQKQSIPSEFINGVEGGEPTVVVQCEYCGQEKPKKKNNRIGPLAQW